MALSVHFKVSSGMCNLMFFILKLRFCEDYIKINYARMIIWPVILQIHWRFFKTFPFIFVRFAVVFFLLYTCICSFQQHLVVQRKNVFLSLSWSRSFDLFLRSIESIFFDIKRFANYFITLLRLRIVYSIASFLL